MYIYSFAINLGTYSISLFSKFSFLFLSKEITLFTTFNIFQEILESGDVDINCKGLKLHFWLLNLYILEVICGNEVV